MVVIAMRVNVHEKGIIKMNIHCAVILFVENLGVNYYEFMISYWPHSDFYQHKYVFILFMTKIKKSKSK
jgi:hypothetical protein